MTDTDDFDQIVKAATKLIEDWGKAIDKIAKMEALKKQRAAAAKDADAANKALSDKIFGLKIPPKADPQQMLKLPDVITKIIDKNGVKIGDYGSLKPDIDLDTKKMQFKKVGLIWTWKF